MDESNVKAFLDELALLCHRYGLMLFGQEEVLRVRPLNQELGGYCVDRETSEFYFFAPGDRHDDQCIQGDIDLVAYDAALIPLGPRTPASTPPISSAEPSTPPVP